MAERWRMEGTRTSSMLSSDLISLDESVNSDDGWGVAFFTRRVLKNDWMSTDGCGSTFVGMVRNGVDSETSGKGSGWVEAETKDSDWIVSFP